MTIQLGPSCLFQSSSKSCEWNGRTLVLSTSIQPCPELQNRHGDASLESRDGVDEILLVQEMEIKTEGAEANILDTEDA